MKPKEGQDLLIDVINMNNVMWAKKVLAEKAILIRVGKKQYKISIKEEKK